MCVRRAALDRTSRTRAASNEVSGPGGAIPIQPFEVEHGAVHTLGLRFGTLAYVPDVASMPDGAWDAIRDLDVLILDALRRDPIRICSPAPRPVRARPW